MTATLDGVRSPEQLVPGDVAALRDTSERFWAQARDYERAAEHVGSGIRAISWEGPAGARFRAAIGPMPERLSVAATAHGRAADALWAHADQIEGCRRRADEAISLWERAGRMTHLAREDARDDARRARWAGRAVPAVAFVDPGAPLRAEALALADSARRSIALSAAETADEVHRAASEAPGDPSIWDELGGAWSDLWHGATDVGAALGNAALSFGNALLRHPDVLAEVVAGMLLIRGGMAMEGGGLVADATGVGAPVGIGVGIVGVGVIVAGAGLLAHGLGRGAVHAMTDSAVSPLSGASRGGGSGTRTLDAAGVRARVHEVTSKGRSRNVRVVEDESRLRELFDELTRGGTDTTPRTGSYANGGRRVTLEDGTTVGLRTESTSGGPTLDIRFPGRMGSVKVHVPWP